MYNAQIVKERVDLLRKQKGINSSDGMLKSLGLNVHLLRQMSDNKEIGCFAFAKISDRLETSTNYLLGRSDNPNMTITITASPSITRTGELSTTTAGNIEHITINEETTETAEEKEILEMIKSLSAVQKAQVVFMIYKMKGCESIGE